MKNKSSKNPFDIKLIKRILEQDKESLKKVGFSDQLFSKYVEGLSELDIYPIHGDIEYDLSYIPEVIGNKKGVFVMCMDVLSVTHAIIGLVDVTSTGIDILIAQSIVLGKDKELAKVVEERRHQSSARWN